MLQRIGMEALSEIERYLRVHYLENILLLSDLPRLGLASQADLPTFVGYREEGRVVAVQAFYRYGRWLPHWESDAAREVMFEDMFQHPVRWIMGVCRMVDPFLERLTRLGVTLSYDEQDYLCSVDRKTFRPHPLQGVRRATHEDIPAIARLRCEFEVEYFGAPATLVDRNWCLQVAERYIAEGTYLAERDGQVVAMVATEAKIPELVQIGAVFTDPAYRGQGLAKGVVSAICAESLQEKQQVTLTVKQDNTAALRAYKALGFQRCDDYRMARLSWP